MIGENVYNDLELIIINVPKNITPLEKVRWVYMKLGELFSYDYTYIDNDKVDRIDLKKQYVNSYQTCKEITMILDFVLNKIDKNIKCKTIERDNVRRGIYGDKHVANEVIIGNEKYLLDLTLDLQLIQSGCKTKEFGFSSDKNSDYDILPFRECEEIDKKLGLLKSGYYTDKKINDLKSVLGKMDFSKLTEKEVIDIKINKIQSLIPKFNGFLEGKNYVDKLLFDILGMNYKEYNLIKGKRMIACFKIIGEHQYWYIYGNEVGLFETDEINISLLLNNGWETRSNSLLNDLYNQQNKNML